MSKAVFEALVIGLGVLFAIAFCIVVVPQLVESGDVPGAFAAGFVNPFSSGYSLNVVLCAFILFAWIIYERSALGIKHGWIAIPLSIVPGVATGFALYLVLQSRQLDRSKAET